MIDLTKEAPAERSYEHEYGPTMKEAAPAHSPQIIFTEKAWLDWSWFVNRAPGEVSVLGEVDMAYFRKYRKAVITDVYLIKQKNSGTMTEFDDAAYAEFIHAWEAKGNNPQSLCAWIHSHVNMDAFWSGTDDSNIKRLTDILPIVVSVVTNKRNEAKGRIDFGGIFKTELSASVCLWRSKPTHDEAAAGLMEQEYQRCVMERPAYERGEFEAQTLGDTVGADGNNWEPGSVEKTAISTDRRWEDYLNEERRICLEERKPAPKRHITRKTEAKPVDDTYSESDVHLAFLSELASDLTTDATLIEDAITAIGIDVFAIRTGIEGIERTCKALGDRLDRYELGEAQDSLFDQDNARDQRRMSGPPVGSCSRAYPDSFYRARGNEVEQPPITLTS